MVSRVGRTQDGVPPRTRVCRGHSQGAATRRGSAATTHRPTARPAADERSCFPTNGYVVASSRCSRRVAAAAHAGGRPRSDTPTITANASGTVHSAGWPSRLAAEALGGAEEEVDADRADRREQADHDARDGPGRGEPRPPDAEHQQRAERGGGHGEGRGHEHPDVDVHARAAPAPRSRPHRRAGPGAAAAAPRRAAGRARRRWTARAAARATWRGTPRTRPPRASP